MTDNDRDCSRGETEVLSPVDREPLFEHFLVIGTAPERAAEAARKMEYDSKSFTSKMMKRIGDFVNGHKKSSVTVFTSDMAEKMSVTTDSTSGEDFTHDTAEYSTPAKTRSFSSTMMSIFRTNKTPHSSSFHKQSSFSTHKSGERSESAAKPKEVSSGHYSDPLEPSLLYHYPLSGSLPPNELSDFCMPMGCRLRHIEDESTLSDIFYGQRQSTRSGRSFTFLLENRSISEASPANQNEAELKQAEENGRSSGRLYGFCVIHSRYLNVSGFAASATGGGDMAMPVMYDFESPVCYAFISKYPFHDLFFPVIYDMINTERILRMEMMDQGEMLPYDTDTHKSGAVRDIDRQTYVYLQRSLLEEILGKIVILPAPRFGETLRFNVSNYLSQPLEFTRSVPSSPFGEYAVNSSNWALPVLLSWMPHEALMWAIGLILCEAKIIVVGAEVGMVSCTVSGLLSLIQPLKWVAPLIPILPLKHFEFVESPVPLLAGLVIDSHAALTVKPSSILKLCNDEENGTLTAVFDVSEREIYVAGSNAALVHDVLMPGTEGLLFQLQAGPEDEDSVRGNQSRNSGKPRSNSAAESTAAPKHRKSGSASVLLKASQESVTGHSLHPQHMDSVFSVTAAKVEHAKFVQECVHKHLAAVIEMAQAHEKARLAQQAAEQAELALAQSDANAGSCDAPEEEKCAAEAETPADSALSSSSLDGEAVAGEGSFRSRRAVSATSETGSNPSPSKLAAATGVATLSSSTSLKQLNSGKSINVQAKSLRWSEIGGILIGDGAGSSAGSTYWVTSQLKSDRQWNQNSQPPSPVRPQPNKDEVAALANSCSFDNDDEADTETNEELDADSGDDNRGPKGDSPRDGDSEDSDDDSSVEEDVEIIGDLVHHTLSLDVTVRTKDARRSSDDSCGPSAELHAENDARDHVSSSAELLLHSESTAGQYSPAEGKSALTVPSCQDSQRSGTHIPDDIFAALSSAAQDSFHIVGLSLENLDSDVRAFIQRFAETQLYSEFSVADMQANS